jgi:hypothetical protein
VAHEGINIMKIDPARERAIAFDTAVATETSVDALLRLLVKLAERVNELEPPRLELITLTFDADGKVATAKGEQRDLSDIVKLYMLGVMAPFLPRIINFAAHSLTSRLHRGVRSGLKTGDVLTSEDVFNELHYVMFSKTRTQNFEAVRTLEVSFMPDGGLKRDDGLPF